MARHVAACAYCQAYKGGRISRESPLEHMFDDRFNSTVCVDLVDLGDEIEGFTMVDRATGLMVMGELPDQSSLTAVGAFERAWIRHSGPPKRVSSDCGPQFTA